MLKGQVKDPVVATQLLFINSHGVPLENEVQDYLQGREVNESTRRGVEVQALLEGLSNLACIIFYYHQIHQRIPFVLGNWRLLGSLFTACRMDLARALKMLSILWCSLSVDRFSIVIVV